MYFYLVASCCCTRIASPLVTPQLPGHDIAGQKSRPPGFQGRMNFWGLHSPMALALAVDLTCGLHVLQVSSPCSSPHPGLGVHLQSLSKMGDNTTWEQITNTSPHIMCFSLPAGFFPPLSSASSSATAQMWYGSNLVVQAITNLLEQFMSWNFYPQQPPI